jgi:tripartite-type tricarboxylate transporter receptor subunit TctC
MTGRSIMDRGRRRFLQFAGAAVAAPALIRPSFAQSYPVRPVRVVVPFAPGGITDVLARLIAEKWSEQLGRQFYVENVTGGSGNIGMGQAAKAAPDGYTVLTAFVSYVINPSLFAKVPYDPVRDFDPVGLAVTSTTVLIINPSVPADTVDELIALIRQSPGTYNYASAGAGTSSHLAGEQFRLSLNLDIVHIPYTGGAPAVASVVAGHTPIGFVAPNVAIPQIADNKVRALAVTSPARSQTMPDVPTMAEAGHPGIEGENWVGFVVPAGTPKNIIATLNGEIVKMLAQPDMKERLAMLGFEPIGDTPEEFAARIKSEVATWGKVIRDAGIKPM